MAGTSTAQQAVRILVNKNLGFIALKAAQKRNLAVAFAKKNMIVYGKAFDLIRVSEKIDLDDLNDVEQNLDKIYPTCSIMF